MLKFNIEFNLVVNLYLSSITSPFYNPKDLGVPVSLM